MSLIYLLLILLALVGVAIGRYPWLRMNRATIALSAAVLLILLGALSLEQAFAALDINTLALLFGMMVLNVNLRLAGFFQLAAQGALRYARSPRSLLAAILLLSGVLSAIFLNDTIVLMFTPLVLEIVQALRRNPLPYLVGLVAAANIGSTATITGNPQNMLIGMASGISFTTFSAHLFPIALFGLTITWLVLILVYRDEFRPGPLPNPPPPARRKPYLPLLRKSLLSAVLMVGAFIAGVPIPLAALTAAALLLITRRLKPSRVFQEIDWSLLIFFSGLFIVTSAIRYAGFSESLFAIVQPLAERGVLPLALVATLLSNLVSNVPAVMLFRPLIPSFPDPQHAWLTLAMATTLAGNLTLLGSVANLIVAETARSRGVQLSFREYLKSGPIITLLTLAFGIFWLVWQVP